MKRKKLFVGAKVIWLDVQEEYRDTSRIYTVDEINGEVVCISDEYSEAEVPASELQIVD